MGEFSDGDLDALAAQLVGLAADVGPDPLNEEPELHGGVDVRAALHGLRGGSSVAVSVVAGDGVGPPGAALAEEGYRVRNCRKAREAKEKKKRQKVQHIAAQNPRFDGGIADVGGRIVDRALPLAIMPAPVVVPSAVMHTIQRGLATSFGGPHLQAAIQEAVRCFDALQLPLDPCVGAIVDFMCKTSDGLVQTKGSLAERLGLSRAQVDKYLPVIADAIVVLDQTSRRKMEFFFSRALTPLMYVDACRYDETPMRVTAQHVEHLVLSGSAPNPDGDQQVQLLPRCLKRLVMGSSTGTSKLLQSECAYAMLGKTHPVDGIEHIVGVKSQSVTFIQDLERGTGEVYARALQRVTCPSDASEKFSLPIRLATTDKGSANSTCERILTQRRGDKWSNPIWNCDVHTVSGCHTKVAVLVKDDVSALLHMALGLQLTGNMIRFRRCVIEDVRSRLVLLHGRPPVAAAAFREFVLDLFLARGPDFQVRRAMIQVYLTGDWRNDAEVEYYFQQPGLDDQIDEGKLRHMIALGVARTLANRQIHVYPRHRWVGFDLSIDQLGLLESTHAILRHSFRRFCLQFGPHPRRTSIAPSAEVPDQLALEDGVEEGGDEQAPGQRAQEGGDVGAPAAAAAAGLESFAEQNERHRKIASNYLQTMPLGRLMILRTIFEPFRKLLNRLIHISSDSWDSAQAAKEAKHMLGTESEPRQFRVQIAARQELENEFAVEVARIVDPECWKYMPVRNMDLQTRGLVFRLISRSKCTVDALLRLPHDTFPTRLFLALDDPEVGEMLANSAECELDAFSKTFIAKFGLVDKEAQAALRFLATMVYLDIVQIEQRHAALRRRLTVMSPTNVPSTADLSAFWTLRQYRLRHRMNNERRDKFMGFVKVKGKVKGKGVKEGNLKKVGGAWRAFVASRARSRPGRADFKLLGVEYAALGADEKEELKKTGRMATLTGRLKTKGQSSFGPNSRKLRRQAAQLLRLQQGLARAARTSTKGDCDAIASALALTNSSLENTEGLAKLMRSESRQANTVVKVVKTADEKCIADFQEKMGDEWRRRLGGLAPELQQLPANLRPWPDRHLTLFEWTPDTTDDASKTISYAVQNSQKTNLLDAMNLDWSTKVAAITSSSAAAPADAPDALGDAGAQKASACQKDGVCVCSEEGQKIRLMSAKFLKSFKPLVRRGTDARDALVNGQIALRLRWEVVPDGEAAGGAAGDGGGDSADPAAQGDIYWHIGWMCLSPYLPSFHVLDCIETSPDGRTRTCQGTWETLTFMRGVETLDRTLKWELQLLRLSDPRRPIASFDPSLAIFERAQDDLHCFWNPQKRRRGGRGRWRAIAIADGDLADAEADEGVGDARAPDDADGGAGGAVDGDEHSDADIEEEVDAGDDLEKALEELLADSHFAMDEEEAAEEVRPLAPVDEYVENPEGEEPVPPPPPPPVAAIPELGPIGPLPRETAKSVTVIFNGGQLAYFYKGKRFQAICSNPDHGRCVCTRSGRLGVTGKEGRPLGLMAAWLKKNGQKEQYDHVYAPDPSFAERAAARTELAKVNGIEKLMAGERPRIEGEGEEPF